MNFFGVLNHYFDRDICVSVCLSVFQLKAIKLCIQKNVCTFSLKINKQTEVQCNKILFSILIDVDIQEVHPFGIFFETLGQLCKQKIMLLEE